MQDKSNSFLQVSPFIPRSGILASSYIAFPIDTLVPRGCLFVSPLENFVGNQASESVAPPLYISTGEGGLSYIPNGGEYAPAAVIFSFPDFYFLVLNQSPPDAPPGFVVPGDLTISNLVVDCPDHPSYFGTITGPGPVAEFFSCDFNAQSGGGSPGNGDVITVSFDWTWGPTSGTYTITLPIHLD